MTKSETAVSLFKTGFSCSQSILAAFGDQFGLDRETALRIAAGFGGGMGRMGQTCGAVTGAFMVIGLKCGGVRAEDRESKENTHQLVRKFREAFREHHGSIICKELLACDIGTPAGSAEARDRNLIRDLCPKFVGDAADILEYILKGENPGDEK